MRIASHCYERDFEVFTPYRVKIQSILLENLV